MNAPRPDAPLLRLHGLALGYGAEPVLAGVDWDGRRRRAWFLLGPNGSGKTTLLRAVLGLLPPQAGTLERDPARASRERIGFVPQRCEMNRALPTTVREFVTLGLVGLRTSRAEREARLVEALALADLDGLAAHSYWSLSGGQRQRALVARALVRRPRLLLLDEPTEGLDVASEDAFLERLAVLHAEHGVTIVFVTHRLGIAARFATHVALAFDGMLTTGPRDVVLASAPAAAAFGAALARVRRPASAS
jgi:ABC-type Mn2+/Zn2+ transport system ATPase subunit